MPEEDASHLDRPQRVRAVGYLSALRCLRSTFLGILERPSVVDAGAADALASMLGHLIFHLAREGWLKREVPLRSIAPTAAHVRRLAKS